MEELKTGIVLEHVNKSFKAKHVLNDIDISIAKGGIYGLLGPSGCGKTTTVKIITGILKADSGMVTVSGHRMPDIEALQSMGYMAQSDALYLTLSAYENLKFFGQIYGLKGAALEQRIEAVLTLMNLESESKTTVGAFSGGMKRRLSLAACLLPEPEVLILDEPTVGIDPVLRESIWAELRKLAETGVTILITTHVMDEAAKCDRLAMMRQGRIIAEGTPQEIVAGSGMDTLEKAFIYYGKERGVDEN